MRNRILETTNAANAVAESEVASPQFADNTESTPDSKLSEVEHLRDLLAWTLRYAVQQQRETERLRRLALTDDLTGLYNRRGFLLLAKQQLKVARRTRQNVLMVFVDVNGLKHVNDSYGHSEGDRILKETAEVLLSSVRDSDIVARVGGDEFVILAQETSAHGERRLASRLKECLKVRNQNQSSALSLSFGFSIFKSRTSSLEDLMSRADLDMYRRKRSRRSSTSSSAERGDSEVDPGTARSA